MKKIVSYLGPAGTFCEEAALASTILDDRWELMPCSTIDAVFAAVQLGKAERGVVPIENSCEGSVNLTLDLLAYDYELEITGEIILPVKHNLLVRSGLNIGDISTVLSHAQALAQCRNYLSKNLGNINLVDIPSTAEAAHRVSTSDEPWAAIGTCMAARTYGLTILKAEIQDRADNETRFISLGLSNLEELSSNHEYPGLDLFKTSLILSVGHQPGALFKALEQFYLYDINMSKIESRPAKTKIGNYLFFIDIDGHLLEPKVVKALRGLETIVNDLRVLGSYPTHNPSAAAH